jgi:hypothetical protein
MELILLSIVATVTILAAEFGAHANRRRGAAAEVAG